jgi:serine/threonine protein kinase
MKQELSANTTLGIVLYELATGLHPFKAETLVGYLHAITLQAPAPLISLQPRIPAALNDLVLRMLDKDARKRPTASEIAQALQEIERKGYGESGRHSESESAIRNPQSAIRNPQSDTPSGASRNATNCARLSMRRRPGADRCFVSRASQPRAWRMSWRCCGKRRGNMRGRQITFCRRRAMRRWLMRTEKRCSLRGAGWKHYSGCRKRRNATAGNSLCS